MDFASFYLHIVAISRGVVRKIRSNSFYLEIRRGISVSLGLLVNSEALTLFTSGCLITALISLDERVSAAILVWHDSRNRGGTGRLGQIYSSHNPVRANARIGPCNV